MIRLLAILLALQINAANVVDLVIKETAGVARLNEDVTMGVPLSEGGGYTDATRFALKDVSGNTLPCTFKAVNMWYKYPTRIRWVQLNFPYSLAANDSAVVRLTYEDAPPVVPSSKLTVQDRGAYFEVNTGKIRFYVKKAGFNLIDQAWVDESGAESYTAGNQVVASHSRGLVFYQADTEYLSSNDAASTVSVERSDAGVVTLAARGVLKSAGGAVPLHFICRLYAFNNSSSVRVSQTVENWDPAVTHYAAFQGFHAEIPLSLGSSRTATVSKPAGYETTALSGSNELYCMVDRPDAVIYSMGVAMQGTLGGAVTGSFNPKTLKPRDLGWVALSDGSKGCLAAMRYFWQMVPTSVEAFADGRLLLGLFSKRSGMTPNMFYAGAARTWETQYTFYNSMTNDQLRSKAAVMTDRLFAIAPAVYYSRGAMAAFPMMEAGNQSFYSDSNWTFVSAWETKLNYVWNSILNADDSHCGFDSYGFLEWGDNPHYDDISDIPAMPWRILWNGNYYGLPYFSFEHFFHTRNLRFLNYAIAHSHHQQDIHMVHFGPSSNNTGGSRYSPPAYHFSTDDPNKVSGAITIDNPSHHMVENLFLDYYLTGNDYALEAGMYGANWFNRGGTSYAQPGENTVTYIRRWAHQMFSLVWACQHTRDSKFYNNLYQNWEAMKSDIRSHSPIGSDFMDGLCMEAIIKMYYILHPTYHTTAGLDVPDSIPQYLKIWADSVARLPINSGQGVNANTTLGYAFLSRFYGSHYQHVAAASANSLPIQPNNLHKDFAQQARNLEMAMYYMARPDSVGDPAGIEDKVNGTEPGVALILSVEPSPFNPAALIRVRGEKIWKNTPLRISIYSADGKLMKNWIDKSGGLIHTVVWDASNLSSGIYFVECRAAGLTVQTRAVLLK